MKNIVFAIVVAVGLLSCKKETLPVVSTAEFTLNKDVLYMHEPLQLVAVDTTGETYYHYDFGDGITATGNHRATHSFSRGGNFTIKMTVDGKTFSKTVTVHPGVLSYQVKNSSTRWYLDIISYIDTWETGTYRDQYSHGQLSKTIYASTPSHGVSSPQNHIFGASIFANNVEYMLYTPNFFWFDEWEHTVFEITDSTLVRPRNQTLNSAVIMIKDMP